MINPVTLKVAEKRVMGQQNNSLINRMKKGSLDVPLFQYKLTILFLF